MRKKELKKSIRAFVDKIDGLEKWLVRLADEPEIEFWGIDMYDVESILNDIKELIK